jgi:uncharacterized protein
MTNIDRRSALIVAAAGALLASSGETLAQSAEEADRNKEILARAYKRWHESKGRSVNEWMEIIDQGIKFGSLAEGGARVAFTARVDGKTELKRYFDGLLGGWEMLHFTVAHFIAERDRVAMVGSTAWRNKATKKVFETPKVDVWRFKDGRAVEFYEYYDTAGLAKATT